MFALSCGVYSYCSAFTLTTNPNIATKALTRPFHRTPFLSDTAVPQNLNYNHAQKKFLNLQSFALSATNTDDNNNDNNNMNADVNSDTNTKQKNIEDSYDVIVVGSGIGGLTTAAMLSLYGYKVAVFESHYLVGGCAHGFTSVGKDPSSGEKVRFQFDTGPSFFSGLNPDIPAKSSNPLRTVLDAIGEQVDCIPYTTFGLQFPEGTFVHSPDFAKSGGVLDQLYSGNETQKLNQNQKQGYDVAVEEWERLLENMKPLAKAVDAMPTAALRADVGALLTTASFLPNFAKINPLDTSKLTTPFQTIIDKSKVSTSFLQNWMDLLCFCLSGLPSKGTITAEMAMMMGEFYDPTAIMDCPKGGAHNIVQALQRGIEKHGGHIFTSAHVNEIKVQDGKITGVELQLRKDNRDRVRFIQAKKAVVSNLSVWDMFMFSSSSSSNTKKKNIIDPSVFPSKFIQERSQTPLGKSFMHVHIGFKATREELQLQQLQAHTIYIEDWERGVEAQDNAALLSIPSVHDDTLAPDGYAVLHIYTPATEDYEKWKPFQNDRTSDAYKQLKQERSQFLFNVLDKVLPDGFDIQKRAVVTQIGTPITHERFLRRYKGSYGPAIVAGKQSFPFPTTPVKGLLLCGDSCFPGIGVPAVAGSGLLAAHSVSFDSIPGQLKLLETLK